MAKEPMTPPFPITGLKRIQTPVTDEFHFTGGLRAKRFGSEWQVGPFLRESGLGAATGIPDAEIGSFGNAVGVRLFGADEITAHDPNLPARIWSPLLGPPPLAHSASDTWGMISSTAHIAGDDAYASLASNLSVSLAIR